MIFLMHFQGKILYFEHYIYDCVFSLIKKRQTHPRIPGFAVGSGAREESKPPDKK